MNRICNRPHTNIVTRPSLKAKKRRCKCKKYHVWVEPPSKKKCGTCGAVIFQRD